ncbi:HNH endonuclease [candidate division TA06 bacterium]|uniref:HNH endonuclease n=1 Tax=candidate division TA06 bacterium TaxID=2250710 RepID=A0A523USB8_UNCT6|nr:MAG: HNH endonuclease [candidate division TA06 bacterium]
MSKCIYCVEEKDPSAFDRDHVIPESFGKFENNLTLHQQQVCRDCNQYFSKKLELFLGRDTVEGTFRYVSGPKDPKDFTTVKESRLLYKLAEEGPWKGAMLRRVTHDKIDAVNQVAFQQRNTGNWVFFPIEDVPSGHELKKQGFILKGDKSFKMVVHPDFGEKKLKQLLTEKGLDIEPDGEVMDFKSGQEKVMVEIQQTVDKVILRGIGKIAFNYLTYAQGADFVLDKRFDGFREFIRYGTTSDTPHVWIEGRPIWLDRKRLPTKHVQEHWVLIDWDETTIFSLLSLFNLTMYKVQFCRRFLVLPGDIRTGNRFNVKTKKISKLYHPPLGLFTA